MSPRLHPSLKLPILLAFSLGLLFAPGSKPFREPAAIAAESYAARGVVKSFGPERKYVAIAHEKIPGYMEAMTMSFEPRAPAQIASLAVGDHVSFRFTEADGGHRLIDTITKE